MKTDSASWALQVLRHSRRMLQARRAACGPEADRGGRWLSCRQAAGSLALCALWLGLPVVLGASLSGCASVNTVASEVASFGAWPEGRAAGAFAFDRLPSQAADPKAQAALESAAQTALESAGFSLAASQAQPEFLVQIGARISRSERSPWDDPLWWRGPWGSWRFGPYPPGPWPMWPPGYGPLMRGDLPRYQREVAVLIRERSSGQPLFEARAVNDGSTPGGMALIAAMFAAAMKDFPLVQPTPRRVTAPLTP